MEIRVGKYRTRDGQTVDVTDIDAGFTWGVSGIMNGVEFGVGDGWRDNGRFYAENCDDPRDLVERIEEPTPVDAEFVPPGLILRSDGEFVPPEFVEVPTPPDTWPVEGLAVPNAGAVGVDVSAASIAPPGPTIRDVVEHERAETAAFESATEEANRHAFAALRALTRALNRHGIAPGSEVADAHAFALLVLDGFES